MPEPKKTVSLFCAAEQMDTDHAVDFDEMGEIILTCECGRFLKLPKGTKAKELKDFVEAHKAVNQGQISTASLEAQKEELLNDLAEL